MGQVLTNIEREITAEVHNRPPVSGPRPLDIAPTVVSAPDLAMPDYVEHRDGATEIGKLSAEAVVREYEAAAKDIEKLGEELAAQVKQCEAMSREAFAATAELKETAERYREEARRVFLQIENCSLKTSEVRKLCGELKDKISVAPAIDAAPKAKKVRPAT
jgi:hypothetical protein